MPIFGTKGEFRYNNRTKYTERNFSYGNIHIINDGLCLVDEIAYRSVTHGRVCSCRTSSNEAGDEMSLA